ncbi:MAG: hypothetical protein QW331_03020 [Candidatus Woesearchaeota archaeon]
MSLEQAFQILTSYSATDIIFPFMLFFSLIYAALKTTNTFKEGNTVTVIALSLAGIIVGLHVNNQIGVYDPINLIKEAGWQIALVLVSFILFLLFVIVASPKTAEKITSGSWGGAIVIFSITIVGLIFATSLNLLPRESVFAYIFNSEMWSFLIAVAVFIMVVWWIGKQ